MKDKSQTCCQENKKDSGFKKGLLYGLLPHTFCIAFIVFSVLGVAGITSFFRQWLLTAYFFPLLITISIILSFVSVVLYLYQNKSLSLAGIKKRARYITILVTSIISVNLFLFLVAFPLAANLSAKNNSNIYNQSNISNLTIDVDLPCSGHAPLVISDLKKNPDIVEVKFRLPNLFDIKYSNKTSEEEILDTEIFKTFKASKI